MRIRTLTSVCAFAVWVSTPPVATPAAGPAPAGPNATFRVIVKMRDAGRSPLLARHGARTARRLHAVSPGSRPRFAARAARAEGARLPDLGRTWVLDLGSRPPAERAAALAALRADPGVAWAEEDKIVRLAYVPNDPSYSSFGSWGQPYDDLYGLKKIGTTAAWDAARGQGVVVAVVDTGIDYNHPDIDGNVWVNAGEIPGNGVDDDGNGYVDDWRGWDFIGASYAVATPDNDPYDGHGHGTHVAGTIAAEGDNGIGVVGVAWRARVMAVKGLDDAGFAFDSTLAAAVVYAADQGADVVNASWGGMGTSQAVADAVEYAHGSGVVFVAAAGNSNSDARLFYPASSPRAVVVSALDPADQKASFSNFGRKVDVAAPGVDILSLARGTGGYVRFQGTSMAAPHVSGVAALILQRHPEFTNDQIRGVLRASATDLGPPGRDDTFGYGRVDAAEATSFDHALETRITAPTEGAAVRAPVTVRGTAAGPGFDRYVLEVGRGDGPTAWTTIHESATPVTAGDLGLFDPSTLVDDVYTLRLRGVTTSARTFTDEVRVDVRYLGFTSPEESPVPSITSVAKPGAPLSLIGRATGPSFAGYRIEWAPGRNAASGWSTQGVTLSAGGALPVVDGLLGVWTPSAGLAGEHTLRIVVQNSGFTSERSTTVYLEPDLATPGWPRFMPLSGGGFSIGAVPVRQADGRMRLVLCGRADFGRRADCRSFDSDGAGPTLSIERPGDGQPVAGELDPAPGEELVVADGQALHILAADLTPLRDVVSPRLERFGLHLISLADLDDDGTLEIIAIARKTDATQEGFYFTGALHVYRANGQPYSAQYPVDVVSPTSAVGWVEASSLAVDLNGDRRKEILVVLLDQERTRYNVLAYNADGSRYAAWPPLAFATDSVDQPIAADLDHDGAPEIVLYEGAAGQTTQRLRVLSRDGTNRPGWPVAFDGNAGVNVGGVSVADLDGDGRDEILVTVFGGLRVFRHDGTEHATFRWPIFIAPGQPLVADVDGDGAAEIVVSYQAAYRDVRLRVMSAAGALEREWRLFGLNGEYAVHGQPTIGDFTGDGKTDIAVHLPLIAGGGPGGVLRDGALSVLTTAAPFDPARADWPLQYHDPQNSRSKLGAPSGAVRVEPVADAYVRDGSAAGTSFGGAATLEVKTTGAAGNTRIAYLRFPLAGVPASVASARLRLYGRRSLTSAALDAAYAVASLTWSEAGLTWNNRPALGERQGPGVNVTTSAQYYEWDVTPFVQAQKTAGASAVSLAVRMESAVDHAPDTFQSKEAASNRPELVVTAGPPALGGHYKILARHSGKAVVVQGASTSNGANVFQWTYGGAATNDEWLFTAIGGGYYKITARHSGKAMVVQNAATANGGDVIQWSYTSAPAANDEWAAESVDGGYYRLVNRHSGKVLNVAGAGTANGANADQWSWANVPQQQFQILAVP